jgi:hypothetical protein
MTNLTKITYADGILNNAVQEVQTDFINEILDTFNLNWRVKKTRLYLDANTETDFYCIVRQDTNKCFSTCKDSYLPFQNTELAELVYRIADKTGYNIHNGGMFNGGGKVFMQLATGETPLNGDTIKKYVTAINSHDGTTSLKWGHTNVTISCTNTFNSAYRDLMNSARHTDNIYFKIEQSLLELGALEKVEKSVLDTFFKFAEQEFKRTDVINIVNRITGVDIEQPRSKLMLEHSGYALNRTDELLEAIAIETSNKGDTHWGLFSGVTKYTTHTMPTPKRDNGRIESKYTGSGYRIDNEIYTMLSESLN